MYMWQCWTLLQLANIVLAIHRSPHSRGPPGPARGIDYPIQENLPPLSNTPGAQRVRSTTMFTRIYDRYHENSDWGTEPSLGRVKFQDMREEGLICTNCTILRIKGDMVDQKGPVQHPLKGLLLEEFHARVEGPSRQDPLFSFDANHLDVRFDEPSQVYDGKAGFYIAPNEQVKSSWTLRDLLISELRWIAFSLDVEYVPGKAPDLKNVRSFKLDINRDSHHEMLQPNSLQTLRRSLQVASPLGGSVAGVNVHVLGGITSIKLFANDALVCTSKPAYEEDLKNSAADLTLAKVDDISNISICNYEGTVQQGDKLVIEEEDSFSSLQPFRDGNYPRSGPLASVIIYVVQPMPV